MIFRRKQIYEELHPETKHGGDRKSDQVANLASCSDRFTEATAAATGKAERNIQRAAARGEALGEVSGASKPGTDRLDRVSSKATGKQCPQFTRRRQHACRQFVEFRSAHKVDGSWL